MPRDLVKVAARNLVGQKTNSLINVFGPSVGVACAVLILVYVAYERSFDRYHANADRIFRVASQRTSQGTENLFATVPAPVGPKMVADFPCAAAISVGYKSYAAARANPAETLRYE